MSVPSTAHGLDGRPDCDVEDACSAVAVLVDRQRAVLAAELPAMIRAAGMQPVELWFAWGALSELLGESVDRVEPAFALFLRRRHDASDATAFRVAIAVRQACTMGNALVDGMALGGRYAVRGLDNDRAFLSAALFLRYAERSAASRGTAMEVSG